jgi:hypothetical protein
MQACMEAQLTERVFTQTKIAWMCCAARITDKGFVNARAKRRSLI